MVLIYIVVDYDPVPSSGVCSFAKLFQVVGDSRSETVKAPDNSFIGNADAQSIEDREQGTVCITAEQQKAGETLKGIC